ncbi:hypothetical protein BEK98_37220 [Streptomyces diastatochromogenes]|uniref:Uncharacterized protein n=1 Tax=Streptomyces diastatochromogenes TaxID=42236 RepID=A0A233S1X3_STRDA|nr:hypothetical protein BEK98_37220 [Streptomyces diastatochromogenes]
MATASVTYQAGAFFLNVWCGGVTTRPPVCAPMRPCAHALIAGIREDLHERSVGQELDQPQLSGLGHIRATARPALHLRQNPAARSRENGIGPLRAGQEPADAEHHGLGGAR